MRDKLDARFKLLTGGARHTLRRHQTLRAALEWSYHLLDADERTVFRRLGAFAGGFTVELAQAVARDATLDEWRVLDILALLVDKSLVSVDAGDAPRYRLLESARAFALEQLMLGHLSAVRQKESARRAVELYRALGQPRREFSALMRLGAKLVVEKDFAGSASVLAQARALVQPDWPAEFHIQLLRRGTRRSHAGRAGTPTRGRCSRNPFAGPAQPATGAWKSSAARRSATSCGPPRRWKKPWRS